jgi:ribosomal protein S27E
LQQKKNDSTYYFEWVPFDAEHAADLKRKQVEVIASDVLLPRIGNNSAQWFECKWCDARHVCFGKKEPRLTCRTCTHVDILPDGVWQCGFEWPGGKEHPSLSVEEQESACDKYELGEMFK